MKIYPLCDPYLWENPKVLLHTGFTWKPRKEGPCASEIVNHIFFIYILAFFVGAVLQVVVGNEMILVGFLAVGTAYILPSVWALWRLRGAAEGFQDAAAVAQVAQATAAAQGALAKIKKEDAALLRTMADLVPPTGTEAYEVYDVIGSGGAPASLILPTARNPFMNVLVDEIKYRPRRAAAASIYDPSVKVALDDFFRTDFYKDPTDVFGRAQSQRQFVAMPSTSIPNDQDSYQKWLYKIPGKTCKEGGREACMPGTDGGPVTWLNVSP